MMNWKETLHFLPATLVALMICPPTASAEDPTSTALVNEINPTESCDIDLAKVENSSLNSYRLAVAGKTKCSLFLTPQNGSYPKRTFTFTGGHILTSVVSEGSPVSHHSQNSSIYIFPIDKSWPKVTKKGILLTPNKLKWELNNLPSDSNNPPSDPKNPPSDPKKSETEAEIKIPTDECEGSITKIDSSLAITKGEKQNKTGFYIKSCKNRILVDTGHSMGWENRGSGRPEQKPEGESTIRFEKKHCTVKNKEIFSYYGTGEYSPKYQTADQWRDFLKNHADCKSLNWDFLNPIVTKPSTSTKSSGAAQ